MPTLPEAADRQHTAGAPGPAAGPVIPIPHLFAILFVLLSGLSPSPGRADSAAAEQQGKLDALRVRIDQLRLSMQAKTGEKDVLSKQLQQSERQIGRLARKLRALDKRLSRQRERIAQLKEEQVEQSHSLEGQKRELMRQVRAAYAMGRQERLKILLNQQDPATVSRMMAYYDYLNRERARRMAAIRAHMQRLADTEHEIAAEEAELVRLHGEQKERLADMQLSQQQRREVVQRLGRELKDQGRQLDRLKSDEQDLQTLIRGLEQALADIPAQHPRQVSFAGRRGKLSWPARGRIVQRFGTARLGGLVWDGVMISAPEGQEVRAIHHGRVAFADWLRGFGLLLIVEHGDGYMTLYGHNQSLFKEVGDWVDMNEPIALVGSSGGRERAGVYFGIRHQGRAVNPARWCKRPRRGRVG